MKTLVIRLISALICVVMFTNCEKAEQKTSGELSVSGDDIISFNITTGEIIFTDWKQEKIISHASSYSEMHFFIDNKPVFVPSIPTMIWKGGFLCGSPFPWASMNDLGFLISLDSKTCCLVEEYLPWHFLSDNANDKEAILKQQEENSKKRSKELDILIEYLRKTGRIVE